VSVYLKTRSNELTCKRQGKRKRFSSRKNSEKLTVNTTKPNLAANGNAKTKPKATKQTDWGYMVK
jgi:hypothetical protein